MKKGKKALCDVCKKNTYVADGWHLEGDLDFCSNQCVAFYIEKTMPLMYKKMKILEKILKRLETLKQPSLESNDVKIG